MFSFDGYLSWNMDGFLLYIVELLIQFEVDRHGGKVICRDAEDRRDGGDVSVRVYFGGHVHVTIRKIYWGAPRLLDVV
jgi:hypothetical protein